MGTKNCPEAPRQRMISMMYLVLTAMLAMNVDKQVLDAFVMVDHSFTQTIENFTAKNQRVYNDFSSAAQENQQKVGELNKTVLQIKANSDSLYHYIHSLKEMIVKRADGPEGDVNAINALGDHSFAAEIMMTQKHGTALKNAIEDYRDFLLTSVDTSNTALVTSIKQSLDTSDPPSKEGSTPTWESSKFVGYPLIAVMTLMSKIQSDVRNAESDVINHLYTQIDASSFKFNKLQAQVVSKSDLILEGGTYEAKVFLSAVDTTVKPEIIVGGTTLQMIPGENAGLYKVVTSKEGKVEWGGRINYKNPDGVIVPYLFKHEYEVQKPSMTVSPTKMNVFYAGLDNPISVSVPGIAMSNIRVSISSGSITPGKDGYIVKNDRPGDKPIVTVKALIDGTEKLIGTMLFRVKKVPDPVASVGGKIDGLISKNDLLTQEGVFAAIPDFDFDMKFKVTSFVVSTIKAGYVVDRPTKGNKFSNDQIDLMKGLNSTNKLYIENIVVYGDDGITRNLPSIIFKIK